MPFSDSILIGVAVAIGATAPLFALLCWGENQAVRCASAMRNAAIEVRGPLSSFRLAARIGGVCGILAFAGLASVGAMLPPHIEDEAILATHSPSANVVAVNPEAGKNDG
jgi:amino acid transporter